MQAFSSQPLGLSLPAMEGPMPMSLNHPQQGKASPFSSLMSAQQMNMGHTLGGPMGQAPQSQLPMHRASQVSILLFLSILQILQVRKPTLIDEPSPYYVLET